ncbi:MAG: hypothetical protein ABL958_00220 [Bdellovibrionia bacterium]
MNFLTLIFTASLAFSAKPTAKNFDKDMSGCEMSCGSHGKHDLSQVKKQSEATLGDFVQCPVSGAVFKISLASETVLVHGKKGYACCAACAKKLEKNPERYAENFD